MKFGILFWIVALLWAQVGYAADAPVTHTSEAQSSQTLTDRIGKVLGFNYFIFFFGPGLTGDALHNPNFLGKPSDQGWTTQTNLSARLKVTSRIAADYQFRVEQVVSNRYLFRNQGGRAGISGDLLKGSDWDLRGALNSDLPGVGEQYSQRTLIADPGLFSRFNWAPRASRWSVHSLVTPRVYFYRDKMAMDAKALAGGFKPGDKPLLLLQFEPSINYGLSAKAGLRLGVTVDYRQNANMDSIQRWFCPAEFGYTYDFSERFKIYPNIKVSTPLDDELRRKQGSLASWTDTMSVGMWLQGTLL